MVDAVELAVVGPAHHGVVAGAHDLAAGAQDGEHPLAVRGLLPLLRLGLAFEQALGRGVAHAIGGILPVAAAEHLVEAALALQHERALDRVPADAPLGLAPGVVDVPVVARQGDRPGVARQGEGIEQAVAHGAGADVAALQEIGGVEEPARAVRRREDVGIDGEPLGGQAVPRVLERAGRVVRHRDPDLHPLLVADAVVEMEAAVEEGDLGGPVAGVLAGQRRERPGQALPGDEVAGMEHAEGAAVVLEAGAVGPVLPAVLEDEGVGEGVGPDRVPVDLHDGTAVAVASTSGPTDAPGSAA